MDSPAANVTLLLQRARDPSDRQACDELFRAVEGELRKIAQGFLRRGGPDPTLQATVLIDEAFMRLVVNSDGSFDGRQEFYRVASGVMRRILVDHARRQRPGRLENEQLVQVPGEAIPAPDERLQRAEGLLALDRALERLRGQDPEAADLFEMYYFGGLRLSLGSTPEEWIIQVPDSKPRVEEIAAVLNLKRATAFRILHRAKAFLQSELEGHAY